MREHIKFSIIVVCLNPGEKLNQTLDSILKQTYPYYEVIVKDGGSKDDAIQHMRIDERIRFFLEKDTGIYDAMNQAVSHVEGEYVLFLNCGDVFFDAMVLERVVHLIEQEGDGSVPAVFYGNTYSEKNDVLIVASPKITGFTCYRNIPCHQSCFYATELCKKKPYDLGFRIRADYDHFLWCYYKAKAKMIFMDLTVASYEGGGYSETRENQKRDQVEHHMIIRNYMKRGEWMGYQVIMLLTLAPIRRMIAESEMFSGIYHKIKDKLYRRANS